MTREEYEERFNAVEKQIRLKQVSLGTGLAMIAVIAQQYQAAHDQEVLAVCQAQVLRFKARYNALPAIPSLAQWKSVCVSTMADIEGWPED